MLDEFRSTLITWDKATSRIYSPVTANASDENGRKLVVQIVNGGQVEDLTGVTLHLYWETRDKAHNGLDVFDVVDLKKGEFALSYTTGMLSNKGVLNANLVLIDTVGRVVSERFKITVTEGIDNDAIQSENSFSSLTKALIEVGPRLNSLTAQLAHKADKSEIGAPTQEQVSAWLEANPEATTTVQDGSLTTPKFADESVTYKKQRLIKFEETTNLFNGVYGGLWVYTDGSKRLYRDSRLRSATIKIRPDAILKIETKGTHNRFTVAFLNDPNGLYIEELLHSDISTTGNETLTVQNKDYQYLLVGVASDETPPAELIVKELNGDMTVEHEVTDIYQGPNSKMWWSDTAKKWAKQANPVSIIRRINPNARIKIKTIGEHNRFAVYTYNKFENGETLPNKIYPSGTSEDSTGNVTYEFQNGGENYIYVIVTNSSASATPTVEITQSFNVKNQTSATEAVGAGAVKSDTGISQSKEIFPVLAAVKMTNAKTAETPRPIGWLYYVPETPYQFLYANGTPESMKPLFNWKPEVTWDGTSGPEKYRPFITREGDVIFVWRGDLASTSATARQNPIVYPAGDYENPIAVPLGTDKPTNWLQNCGADYLYNDDVFLFAEYTRPVHSHAHVWKVTKPFTNPANWKIVQSFRVGDEIDVTGIKHFHTVNYDTFSDRVFLSSGDSNDDSKIYMSADKGATWQVVLEGLARHSRVLNFVFTKDKVYWANDDPSHYFYSVNRGTDAVPDFTTIQELHNLSGVPPTYINCLIEEPYGILMLHRYDGASANPLPVHFWDLKTNTMHIIRQIDQTEGNTGAFGFRVEAVNWYHAKGDSRIVVGFNSPSNTLSLLGNKNAADNIDRINNLVLKVVENSGVFALDVSTIAKQ